MYDVVSGSITIDGVDIKQLEMASLRRNVAIVSQEVYIFRGTIADNIRYAKPDATLDEVVSAAKAANAHDFILQLVTRPRSVSAAARCREESASAFPSRAPCCSTRPC